MLAVRPELEGATPIVPIRAVVLHPVVQTIDEWPLPWEGESLALHPDLAKEVAHALLQAVAELEQDL